MIAIPVIVIVDIGKTNKKLLLYDESYTLVHQLIQTIPETLDDDGFPSENLSLLTELVLKWVDEILADDKFDVKAINFTAYGASLVYLDENGQPLPILYNYLKPYPAALSKEFYRTYGSPQTIALETASPMLGNLNSGMQLYWLKKCKPEIFNQIHTVLHLPQYISYLISGRVASEKTSIGCHTQLWDFNLNQYHRWVKSEQLDHLFPPLVDSSSSYSILRNGKEIHVGVGLHDSSSALIPYTTLLNTPFVLISTGTWSISLNPFNQDPLVEKELNQDCLCYIQPSGKPVKASRLFLGHLHEVGSSRIAAHFALPQDFFVSIKYDLKNHELSIDYINGRQCIDFEEVDLMEIGSPDLAYHILIAMLIDQQVNSTSLVFGCPEPDTILLDGGFSQNELFLTILKNKFPSKRIFASMLSQSTSLGAASILHPLWNKTLLIPDSLDLREVG